MPSGAVVFQFHKAQGFTIVLPSVFAVRIGADLPTVFVGESHPFSRCLAFALDHEFAFFFNLITGVARKRHGPVAGGNVPVGNLSVAESPAVDTRVPRMAESATLLTKRFLIDAAAPCSRYGLLKG